MLKKGPIFIYIVLSLVLVSTFFIDRSLFKRDLQKQDIFYIYLEGKRLATGENPYNRIVGKSMKVNDKYATYLPGFYCFTFCTYQLGLEEFEAFIGFWRHAVLLLHLSIGFLIFYTFKENNQHALGLFFCCFWLWNRWSLVVVELAHIDFAAILPLMVALVLFNKKKRLSRLCFGLSMALKHIGIFAGPFFILDTIKKRNKTELFLSLFWISLIPMLFVLPFLISGPEGFLKSIFFSISRKADFHINVWSLDTYLNWSGLLAKTPMLFMLSLLYGLYYFNKIGIALGACLSLFIFLDFNHVIFMQYFCWVTALVPLAILELLNRKSLRT